MNSNPTSLLPFTSIHHSSNSNPTLHNQPYPLQQLIHTFNKRTYPTMSKLHITSPPTPKPTSTPQHQRRNSNPSQVFHWLTLTASFLTLCILVYKASIHSPASLQYCLERLHVCRRFSMGCQGNRRCRLRPDPVLEDRVPRCHIQVEGTRYAINRHSKEL